MASNQLPCFTPDCPNELAAPGDLLCSSCLENIPLEPDLNLNLNLDLNPGRELDLGGSPAQSRAVFHDEDNVAADENNSVGDWGNTLGTTPFNFEGGTNSLQAQNAPEGRGPIVQAQTLEAPQQFSPGTTEEHQGTSQRIPATRKKAEFSEEELHEALPKDSSEFRKAFEGLRDRLLQGRQDKNIKGVKYLSHQHVKRIMDIQDGTIKTDASEKFTALHHFEKRSGGPHGCRLIRKVAPPKQKASKDNMTVEAGWVVPTESWFDVAWEAHSSLHGQRSFGRDATMKRIDDSGYYHPVPKDLVQAFIDRCPHPSCRESSRLAKAQIAAGVGQGSPQQPTASAANAPAPRSRGLQNGRRQHKVAVRRARSAEEATEGPPEFAAAANDNLQQSWTEGTREAPTMPPQQAPTGTGQEPYFTGAFPNVTSGPSQSQSRYIGGFQEATSDPSFPQFPHMPAPEHNAWTPQQPNVAGDFPEGAYHQSLQQLQQRQMVSMPFRTTPRQAVQQSYHVAGGLPDGGFHRNLRQFEPGQTAEASTMSWSRTNTTGSSSDDSVDPVLRQQPSYTAGGLPGSGFHQSLEQTLEAPTMLQHQTNTAEGPLDIPNDSILPQESTSLEESNGEPIPPWVEFWINGLRQDLTHEGFLG